MKKTAYIAPKTEVHLIEGEILMNAISNPTTTTGAAGLGVSDADYEDEGRVREDAAWDIWGNE